jgi:ATP-dependent helicase/nuclease subunit A
VSEPWTPTPEQHAAIEVGRSAAVRAGAGSGKTAVLARRFVHLLRPGPDGEPPVVSEVGAILAITFTEKAAAEMKRKIREVVAEELAAGGGTHWLSVQRDLLAAPISTIHAFCARVLRENPLEARIDPRAVVLDEHESRAYIEATVEAALLARLRARDRGAEELVLRAGLAGGRTGGAVGLCADFLARLARTGHDGAWLVAATGRQAAETVAMSAALREAIGRLIGAVEARLARGRGGAARHAFAAAWPGWKARLSRLGSDTPLEEFLAVRDLRRLLASTGLAGEVKAELDVHEGRVRGALGEAWGALRATRENERLAGLIAAIGDELCARKRDDGVLTFDDLIAETHALLSTLPAVRERYARRFRAILVDEFQDTDRIQADVVRLLAAGSPSPLVFLVGDEKQSIYRFRGADVSVFHEMREELGHELTLGTNFRSVPAILEFVNTLAATIFQVPAGGDPAHWTRFEPEQRLVASRAAIGGAPPVRLVTFVEEHGRRELKAAEARELEARVLAGVVERLRSEERVGYGDIAVLFRAFPEVKTYEAALRRREIPYYVVKGRGFFQCQEVSDIVSLLAAVLDPGDGIALAAALRSPLFGLDDDLLCRLAWPEGRERPRLARRFGARDRFADVPSEADRLGGIRDLLARLRALASRATVAELIEEVCAATDFESVCLTQFQGAQKVANVRKLIELARDWERRRFFSLRDFVRTIRRLQGTEPREPEAPLVAEADDVVRLMTIHQAKGLEFPVVVVPDLGRSLRPDTRMPALDDDLGVVSGPLDASGRVVVGHAGLEAHRARERDRDHAEQARLLYVACTRAKDVLVLLEGKGDVRWLREEKGERHVWCHQVWDVIGRDAVARFVAGEAEAETIALPAGGAVRLERAGRYLDPAGAGPPMPEPRVAPAGPAERAAVARVLEFTPPAPTETVTSPTALADFRRCPRQYWYRHAIGLAERGGGGRRATLLGTAAHAVLEALDLGAPAAEIDHDIARRLAARPETLALPPADVEQLAADLRAAAAAFRADAAAGLEILEREVPFLLALPAGRPQVLVGGRLDVLGRRDGTHVVRDYKYARPGPEAFASHAPQLGPYQLAVRAAGAERVEAELVFLRGGPTVHRLPPLDAAAEEAALIAAGVALGHARTAGTIDAFPRRPEAPEVCERLGCGYVRRCWELGPRRADLTRRASGPPSGSAAS